MIVAKSDEWPQLQLRLHAGRTVEQFVFNLHGVAAMEHEDGLLVLYALDFKDECREVVLTEISQILISPRMDGPGILVGRKVDPAISQHQRFLQLRQQQNAAARRIQGGGKQTMVAASVCTRDRSTCKSPQPIRLQPFMGKVRLQLAATRSAEVD